MAKEFSYRILYDACDSNPREKDNVGLIALYPNPYINSEINMNDFPNSNEIVVMFPLYFFAEDGVKFSLSFDFPINDERYTTNAGFVVVTRKQIEKIYGKLNIDQILMKEITKRVYKEIEEYNAYLNGECWGYQVFGTDYGSVELVAQGNGYNSYDEAEKEALKQVDYLIKNSIQPTLFELEPIVNKLDDVY